MTKAPQVLTEFFWLEQLYRIEAYVGRGGYAALKKALAEMKPEQVHDEVKKAGLRGRGGAGFPAGVKWGFIPKGTDKPKYLCVNADEGEPGTFKDKSILSHDPHLLIEGIVLASYAVGIHTAYVYIRGEYEMIARRLEQAIDEAREAGFLGRNILGSGFDLEIVVHRGAGAYVCGEETALLESLEGKRGNPRLKPPFPAVVGLFQCPTVINNVETLANVPLIISHGASWFLDLGLPKDGGTRIFGVSGPVAKPGIYELPSGTSLREIIFTHAGGMKDGRKLKAVIPGGMSSPILRADEIDVRMDVDSVAAAGSMLGSGGIIVIADDTPILQVLRKIAGFYAHESCGQCTPCRLGTSWIHKTVERMAAGRGQAGDVEALIRLAANIQGRTLCPLGDAAAMPVTAIARKFRAELEGGLAEAGARPMIKLFIDGAAVEVPEGTTVFKAAERAGIALPHFCFHPAFVPEGTCRLCLVQIEGSPKLELSCSTVVREGMKVVTQSPAVREARRGVLEFLLAEHPLDCPICDKAGECKLQDYSRDYGLTESFFREFKEKRDKKVVIGEKLLLDRERCIQCTRCVRFLAEVTKTHELGLFERGVRTEIGILEGAPVGNGYSGNLVDLCPVGAITDTDFRFKTRPWFLSRGESVCPHCGRGCNIYVDYQPGFPRVPGSARVFRVRPRTNEAVNGPWICDAGRYGYVQAQNEGRSDRPFWNKDGAKTELGWDAAMTLLGDRLRALAAAGRADRVAVAASSWLTNEELFLLKKIFRDDFGAGRIVLCDPRPGEGDGLLRRPDRTPNARGARELGFDPAPETLEALVRGTEVLILFGPHIAERFAADDLRAALRGIALKVLVTPHLTGLEGLMDGVLASATPAEKDGSFTNFEGRVQPFAAAARPCPDVRPELAILAALAGSLGLRPDYYGRLTSAAAVRRELAKDIPFFGGAA